MSAWRNKTQVMQGTLGTAARSGSECRVKFSVALTLLPAPQRIRAAGQRNPRLVGGLFDLLVVPVLADAPRMAEKLPDASEWHVTGRSHAAEAREGIMLMVRINPDTLAATNALKTTK